MPVGGTMTESERRYFTDKVGMLDEQIQEVGELLGQPQRPPEVYADDLQRHRELGYIRSEIEHRLIGQQALFEYELPEVA